MNAIVSRRSTLGIHDDDNSTDDDDESDAAWGIERPQPRRPFLASFPLAAAPAAAAQPKEEEAVTLVGPLDPLPRRAAPPRGGNRGPSTTLPAPPSPPSPPTPTIQLILPDDFFFSVA